MNKLVMITGPSGSGKTTLEKTLCREGQCVKLTSFTTRSPRPGEIEGEDYYFVTPLQVEKWEGSGHLVEHVIFSGEHYGLTSSEVNGKLSTSNCCVVVEPNGVHHLRQYCTINGIPYEVVALVPPLEETLFRLTYRHFGENMNKRGPVQISRQLSKRLLTVIQKEVPVFYNEFGFSKTTYEYPLSEANVLGEDVIFGSPGYEKIVELFK